MHCTNCGSAIADDARYCGGCGAPSKGPATRASSSTVAHPGNPLARMGLGSFLVLMVAILWVASSLSGSKDPVKPPIEPKAAALRAKGCDEGLAALAKAGVLMRRPAADRMEVEEYRWASLPAQQKLTFAVALRCSALAGYDADNKTEVATVEGYRGGKLLVTAGPDGPILN